MKKLWWSFGLVMVISFAILGWIGTHIYQETPPIPTQVVTTEGKVVIADGDVGRGQNVWQTMGGMQVGSIWGHGSYVAPDWTADWLHREAMFVLNSWAAEAGKPYADLIPEEQALCSAKIPSGFELKHFRRDLQVVDVSWRFNCGPQPELCFGGFRKRALHTCKFVAPPLRWPLSAEIPGSILANVGNSCFP